jgi:hypothetical protein
MGNAFTGMIAWGPAEQGANVSLSRTLGGDERLAMTQARFGT